MSQPARLNSAAGASLAPARSIDPTVRFRRRAGAFALPLAFALQVAANTLYAWATTSGMGDSGTGAQTLEFYRAFPEMALAATLLALAGILIAVPGLLAGLRVVRPHKPRLGLWAVTLMIAGYICYFGLVASNFTTLALAQLHPEAGDVLDAAQANVAMMPLFVLFALGNLVGTLLLGLAVLLSRDAPRVGGALIMCWSVGHLVNILGGGEWFAVAGGALEVAGLCIVAAHAFRVSDEEWAARG